MRHIRAAGALFVLLALAGCAAIPPAAPSPPSPAPTPLAPLAPAGDFDFTGRFVQGGLVMGTAPAGTVALTLNAAAVPIAPDGRFIIGFGRDHGPAATLVATLADGRTVRADRAVAPTPWSIERLPTLPRGVNESAEFKRRRAAELARIEAARSIRSDAQGWRQRFLWPVTGRISGVFGSQRIYAGEPGAPHSGVDIARPAGTPVLAPADGVVILATDAPFTLEGKLLMIDHGMELNSAFLHLSRIDVRPGDRVTRGQTIGAIGATGRTTGPHLHWGMKWRGERLDPQPLAGPMPGG